MKLAQSIEHCTGITEVMGSNPVEASDYFFSIYDLCHMHIIMKIVYSVICSLENTNKKHARNICQISLYFQQTYCAFYL